LDRATVKATVKNEKIDTGLKSLGVMVGDGTHIGIKASTMPGVIIGGNVVVGSETAVMNNIDDNTKYYTKFQEVVIKQ
jgi:bifunctional UDP-N-acetylglucosamine pyrophosphorylase/glucosamine-1-phosphate N-acetyltransferase